MTAARGPRRARLAGLLTSSGIVLFALAAYVLSGPGRIDVSDGAFRFEVAQGLAREGRPTIRDPDLAVFGGTRDADGVPLAWANMARALPGVPLVAAGLAAGDAEGELARFLFSHASAVGGALVLAVLFAFYRRLGLAPGAALGWTAVAGFATLLWPASTTTYDQIFHGLVALTALRLAFEARERRSLAWAAAGGLVAGVLFHFQESYGFLVVALAIPTLGARAPGRRLPEGWTRFVLFGAAAALGLMTYYAYSRISAADIVGGSYAPPYPVLRSPVAGVVSLLASPGKSVFLFCPPILLAILGFGALRRDRPRLALAIAAGTVAHGLLVSSLSFFAGDWAWGPRYLVTLVPLWAVLFPFGAARLRRPALAAVVAAGLAVQLLAISIDHNRYFMERALHPMFWAYDRWAYWKLDPQLPARAREIWTSLRDGAPPASAEFAPSLHPGSVTHCVSMPPRRELHTTPAWMRAFRVFYLPRPWPLWMSRIEPARRPIAPGPATAAVAALGLVGAALGAAGLRRHDEPRPPRT